MYDSQTDKSRVPGGHHYLTKSDRMGCYCCTHTDPAVARHKAKVDEVRIGEQAITEGVVAYLEEKQQAKVTYTEMADIDDDVRDLDGSTWLPELVASNLFNISSVLAKWEWELLDGDQYGTYPDYVDEFNQVHKLEECDDLEPEPYEEPGWMRDDVYFEGDGHPNMYSHDDEWMPLATIEQAREIFGGGDFTILHTNYIRTTPAWRR